MTDRASSAAILGWILTVEGSSQGRRGGSSPQVWLAMYPEADQAVAVVRKAVGVSRLAMVVAHQPISDSLAAALNLNAGQLKRFS
jgi:hypothetical protein